MKEKDPRGLIDENTRVALCSLIEYGRIPTKLELKRFMQPYIQQARQEVADNMLGVIGLWLERHAPTTFPWNGWNDFIKELKNKQW